MAATRYVAFLRAINVGGHVVKMDRLREMFETLGFSNVKTFIASGNVLFDSEARSIPALEARIGKHLRNELGYDVVTFIRSAADVKRIAAAAPFPPRDVDSAHSVYVGLVAGSMSAAIRKTIVGFRTDIDQFHAEAGELHWLCRISVMDSKVSFALLEKTLGGPATFRNVNTIRRIAAILE